MKAIITNTSEVEINGTQSVTFDIVNDKGDVLVASSVVEDVDKLEELIKAQVLDYESKCKSEKRLKVGDEIEA